ncbi:DUF6969 family protein [Sphingobium sp. TKS]|uniref:DUF6969 family protein n=1 Tax=Sphingobium sp. TKS TaxID=1315974 RepID=UPI0007701800|nr:hypothetical protein [Sphingobium sp. TKS]AMK21663.1 hypothetical protein K426_03535 [Sphingobium sp. TKS]
MKKVEAARIVTDMIVRMASEGRPLMTRVLPATDAICWEHYPDDDARDRETRSRWYYHVHAPGDRDPAEHGHFHLFLHRTQMDEGAEIIAAPAEGDDAPALVAHIAGLSIDRQGIPITWFATNRWVTDEFMHPAEVLIAHLDRFNVDHTDEDDAVNRFLTAMVALYRDELGQLLRERDAALACLQKVAGPESIYESGNAVLASLAIDIDDKIESLGIL